MNYSAYYDGKFMRRDDIRIPLSDRSIFFADAVYDAAIARNGKIYLKNAHIERFLKNAAALDIKLPISITELSTLLDKVVSKGGESDIFLYFQLSRRASQRKHSYPDDTDGCLLITADSITLSSPQKRLKLISYPDIRYELCSIKTVNLLPAVLASKEAERRGADEAVFHKNGYVTECAHSNIHIIKNGVLITHPADSSILPGICRKRLLKKCTELGIPVHERPFSLDELKCADEVLVTSSSKLCLLADEFEDTHFPINENGPGEQLCCIMRADFEAATAIG